MIGKAHGPRVTRLWGSASRKLAIALAGLFGLALAVRVWGINFGLPHLYHPDEGYLVMPAINILRTGDFRPVRLDYGSAYIYSLTGLYIPYFVYGAWRGLFHVVADLPFFPDTHVIDQYPFPVVYLIARFWTALLGSLTVFTTYALGKRLLGRGAGLAAATFCALAPFGIQNAHFATTDVPMTFVLTLALVCAFNVFDRGGWRDYGWAGFWVGLTASTKFPGGLVLMALLVAHVLRARSLSDWFNRQLALGLAATVAGFLVGTPYALDLPYFLNWLAINVGRYGASGVEQTAAGSTPAFYLQQLLSGPAAPMTILGLVGITWLWRRNWRRAAVLSTFPALFAVLISIQHVRYARFLVPLEPFLAVGAGLLVVAVAQRLARWQPPRKARPAAVWLGAAGLVLLFLLLASLRWDYFLSGPDVRTEARAWFDANVPLDARIGADPMGPPLAGTRAIYLTWNLAEHAAAWYSAQQFEYLVISEVVISDANLSAQAAAGYQDLRQHFTLVKTFVGAIGGTENQHIWVYRVAP